ncbi:unnamed protein product [Nezara viridula]|uniref:Tr-type G domain-containing protein n=1 Tax=Nezara viridula TaxID=85310 RepID=A0A9P0HV03_NEZVI|nr:unnamed protein product [Nezara viridula]
MRLISQEKLSELQKNPKNIRNICIVAHVDHGKTTLADSLIASNGVISPRMAGKLRYMDSRKDEQERGITMKSSSISLYHTLGGSEYLINLIDSPGHVDFSSEVSTAVRLCDGAILVIDVVEGVCPQTQVALRQTWIENIKPVLVLNKIDRLILEMKLTPLDAFIHLTQILEQVNAVMGELFATEVLGRTEKESSQTPNQTHTTYDWDSGLDDADDSNIYFSPELDNVVFASAIDGWGFRLDNFVNLYATKFDLDEQHLKKCLWGDFYFNSKTKKILPGAQEKAKKPIFVQFVLDNIWALYDTICVRKDKEKLSKIIETVGVKITTRDMRHNDPKVQLQAVSSQWLPLANSVLEMVCQILPPSNQLPEEKVEKLMCSTKESLQHYPLETQSLKKAFLNCSSTENDPLIVYISKMFPMERKSLPQNRPQALTPEEMAKRREQAKLRHAAKLAGTVLEDEADKAPTPEPEPELSEDVFIAFARVYSGCLKQGSSVYVLGPKHDPAEALRMIKKGEEIEENIPVKDWKPGHHATKIKISELYLMMGRELEIVNEAPAGNVIGIGGLDDYVLKSATLSSEIFCPSFSEITLMAVPILRVAVEPVKPSDLPQLIKGLKLLNQADACVQVLVQETGEHVLITAGEVHLERCLDDLRTRFAKIEINSSEPIIPFRETVVPPPVLDMVNEAIQEQYISKKETTESSNVDSEGLVTMTTPGKQAEIKILCASLPASVTDILDKNVDLIKIVDKFISSLEKINKIEDGLDKLNLKDENITNIPLQLSEKTLREISIFKEKLAHAFSEAGPPWSEDNFVEKIWSFGPRRCGPNILFNTIQGYHHNFWEQATAEVSNSMLHEYNSSFINGFQMATLAGPLCEEPMMGVAFIIKDWTIESTASGAYGPFSGQIMSAVKEGCRKGFQAQPQRLMAAMYKCNIQVNAEVLVPLASAHGEPYVLYVTLERLLESRNGLALRFEVVGVGDAE